MAAAKDKSPLFGGVNSLLQQGQSAATAFAGTVSKVVSETEETAAKAQDTVKGGIGQVQDGVKGGVDQAARTIGSLFASNPFKKDVGGSTNGDGGSPDDKVGETPPAAPKDATAAAAAAAGGIQESLKGVQSSLQEGFDQTARNLGSLLTSISFKKNGTNGQVSGKESGEPENVTSVADRAIGGVELAAGSTSSAGTSGAAAGGIAGYFAKIFENCCNPAPKKKE